MTGRAEIDSLRKRLNSTFARLKTVSDDPEVLSDLARHLCVLVAGFLERAIVEVLVEHTRTRSDASVLRHVERELQRTTNLNSQRLLDVVGSFDPHWRESLEQFLVDEYRDAVNSIINLRHTVAHGRFTGVTMARVEGYYTLVDQVVEHVENTCLPH